MLPSVLSRVGGFFPVNSAAQEAVDGAECADAEQPLIGEEGKEQNE